MNRLLLAALLAWSLLPNDATAQACHGSVVVGGETVLVIAENKAAVEFRNFGSAVTADFGPLDKNGCPTLQVRINLDKLCPIDGSAELAACAAHFANKPAQEQKR